MYSIYYIENVENITVHYFYYFFIMCFGADSEHYGGPKLNPDWKPHLSTPCLNVYFIMTENPLSQCWHVTNKLIKTDPALWAPGGSVALSNHLPTNSPEAFHYLYKISSVLTK